MFLEVPEYACVVLESFESGLDEDSDGFKASVARISASFGLLWNDCLVDDKPDNLTGFHNKT
jgi:hypothetical protein